MAHLHEKRQLGIRGVRYVDDVDYAIPVRRKDVPEELVNAIEGNPVERTNKGVVLAKAPGTQCGCFGGFIEDNSVGECPWLYIFIPPEIPNPDAANYTSKRGHPPAKTIKNMTQARKRELRDLCAKVGWELDTEDLWEKPDSSGVEDQEDEGRLKKDVPGKDWTTLSNKGDDPRVRNFYKSMEEMRDSGWHSWMIAPEGNFDKPERWKVGVGQERAEDDFRYKYYGSHEDDLADDVVATYGSMKAGDDDFTGYGRVTESTKVTLTIKQLKRLVRESEGVTTKCYGKEKKWPSRQAAIDYFTEGMYSCDEGSSEYDRYVSIVAQLEDGADYAADDLDSGGGYPLYETPRPPRRRRRSVRESLGGYDLSGVKKGDILYSSGGYNMILVSFYKVAQITGRTVLLQPLKNKIVSGDVMSGKCVPDEDRSDGGYVRRRLSNGRLKGKYDSELLKIWDGQPKMFDHWD